MQVRVFSEVRDTIPPDAAQRWVEEVMAWEMQRKLPVKDQTAPNPYEMVKNGKSLVTQPKAPLTFLVWQGGVTEAQVCLQLRKEETDEVHEG